MTTTTKPAFAFVTMLGDIHTRFESAFDMGRAMSDIEASGFRTMLDCVRLEGKREDFLDLTPEEKAEYLRGFSSSRAVPAVQSTSIERK